jgi:hypothetical protein
MEIKQVILRTRQPAGDDPGRCEIGFYKVEKNMVVMTDAEGRPTGKRLALGPGDDPERIARRLMRESWLKRSRDGDFNRPLAYPAIGLA